MDDILRIKETDPELLFINLDGGGSPIYKYKGQYFTGIVEDYLDGILNYEAEYENGYLEGWVRFYHPNGDLETVKKLHNNVLIPGTYKRFDEDGYLIHSM